MSVHSNSSSLRDQRKMYRIRRNPDDDKLDFYPPEGSRQLKDALHYHFPEEIDYTSRIRRAIRDFCEEDGSPLTEVLPVDNDTETLSITSTKNVTRRSSASSRSRTHSRRTFSPAESAKIYKNRGQTCDKHRRQKVKCDPDVCEHNKQFSRRPQTIAHHTLPTGVTTASPLPFDRPNQIPEHFAPYPYDSSEQLQFPQPQQSQQQEQQPYVHVVSDGSHEFMPMMNSDFTSTQPIILPYGPPSGSSYGYYNHYQPTLFTVSPYSYPAATSESDRSNYADYSFHDAREAPEDTTNRDAGLHHHNEKLLPKLFRVRILLSFTKKLSQVFQPSRALY